MKTPKVLFIDWNGTLSNSKFWGHLEHGDEQKIFKRIESYLFKENRDILDPWMKADLTSEDVCEMISKDLSLNYQKVFSSFVKSCEQMELVEPSLLDTILNLRNSNFLVYIATDNMDSFDRWTAPSLKLPQYFDGILNSYNLKARKRDFDNKSRSLFFKDFLNSKNIDPNESVLIDDAEDKDEKITKYGMNYIQINNSLSLLQVLKDIEEKAFKSTSSLNK